jgi:toxin-antitoxin system PIN domain toxin
MIIPDLNLLLYAVNVDAPQNRQAARWLSASLSGDEPIGLTWIVLVGFVRISTHPRVFRSPLPAKRAVSFVDAWLSRRPVTVIEPGLNHWKILSSLLLESGTAGNLTNDAHLAAMAIERGATVMSADGDFSRFRGLRWENPLLAR